MKTSTLIWLAVGYWLLKDMFVPGPAHAAAADTSNLGPYQAPSSPPGDYTPIDFSAYGQPQVYAP